MANRKWQIRRNAKWKRHHRQIFKEQSRSAAVEPALRCRRRSSSAVEPFAPMLIMYTASVGLAQKRKSSWIGYDNTIN